MPLSCVSAGHTDRDVDQSASFGVKYELTRGMIVAAGNAPGQTVSEDRPVDHRCRAKRRCWYRCYQRRSDQFS